METPNRSRPSVEYTPHVWARKHNPWAWNPDESWVDYTGM
jgi:hypothetical protein